MIRNIIGEYFIDIKQLRFNLNIYLHQAASPFKRCNNRREIYIALSHDIIAILYRVGRGRFGHGAPQGNLNFLLELASIITKFSLEIAALI